MQGIFATGATSVLIAANEGRKRKGKNKSCFGEYVRGKDENRNQPVKKSLLLFERIDDLVYLIPVALVIHLRRPHEKTVKEIG